MLSDIIKLLMTQNLAYVDLRDLDNPFFAKAQIDYRPRISITIPNIIVSVFQRISISTNSSGPGEIVLKVIYTCIMMT